MRKPIYILFVYELYYICLMIKILFEFNLMVCIINNSWEYFYMESDHLL